MKPSARLVLRLCLGLSAVSCAVGRNPEGVIEHHTHARASRQALDGQAGHCKLGDPQQIADLWAAAKESEEKFNTCPTSSWLAAYHGIVGDSAPKIIIDIGTNKAYMLFRMLDEFLPTQHLTPHRLYLILNQMKPGPQNGWCGDCSECKAKYVPEEEQRSIKQLPQQLPDDLSQALRVYSFEASAPNCEALEYVKRAFFSVDDMAPVPSVHWSIFNMAVANFTGEVQFPANCLREYCRMKFDGMEDVDKDLMADLEIVPTIAIDDIVAGELIPQGQETFDILKMDGQRFDPLLLQGAAATLKAQRPAIVHFQYNFFGAWDFTSLHEVVHQMHGYGYICYLDGSPTMLRLTGCWHPSYEYRYYGTVVCARAVDSGVIQAFDRLSFHAGQSS